MEIVILESPYAGGVKQNIIYNKICVLDSLYRNEAPILSHLLYTQFLDDNVPKERALGISAGLAWRKVADKSVVYTDLGISDGMKHGIKVAKSCGLEIEYRRIL